MTQVQLAATLGIAQQTLAHYDGGRLRLPASRLPTLAQELQVAVESLLGQSSTAKAAAKLGAGAQTDAAFGAHQRTAQDAAEVREADARDSAGAAKALNITRRMQ